VKRWLALLLVIAIVCGLTACGSELKETPKLSDKLSELPAEQKQEAPVKKEPQKEPQKATQKKPVPEEMTQTPEREEVETIMDYRMFDGIYRLEAKNEEGIETYVEVRGYPEFLLLEFFQTYEGSTYSFWVEEFWPDEDGVIGAGTKLQGKSQEFSLMSRGNIYSAMPQDRTISLTEDGLILQYKDISEDRYVRDDSYGPYHTPEEELIQRLNEMVTVTSEPEIVGCWGFWDGWSTVRISFEENGGFHFLCKEPGHPIRVFDGAWGIDAETGDIQIAAELVGDGQYPYHVTWQWHLDDSNFLYLVDEEEFLLQELGNDVGFWCVEETDPLNITQFDAMGYVWDSYDLSGEYTDQYGTEYYYSYRLPVFLEDADDLAEINEEIQDIFVPIIEEELAAMEREEFLTFDTVDWNLYVTEGIVTLHVYGFSWEVEQHRTWYYDLRDRKQVDSRELLKRIGMDETMFLEAVRSEAEAYYVETFSGMPEEDREAYGYYDMLEWTVSDEAVNLDLPVFVDRVGNICVYARIGSIAGAGEFWTPLYPFADWDLSEEAVG